LGILAHVDAGKTTLTERLLHAAGVIDEVGSVAAGSTHTDTLALERARGITIRSAVVSFVVDGVTVNLIDTPGHPDFIAEVDRVLDVLDGAVLVVSAVEGVQAQTRILMRALQRLHIPTLVFVNKVDRRGARDAEVVQEIRNRLTPTAVPLGDVVGAGTPAATVTPWPPSDSRWLPGALEVLAEHDRALLSSYVEDEASITPRRLRRALARQTRQCLAHPVLFGSAITGVGVDALSAAVVDLLPAPAGDPDAPVAGTVFKVARGPSGERVAYARLTAGTLRTRDVVAVGPDRTAKVTAISVFDDGAVVPSGVVPAGRIAQVWGLGEVRVGDAVGAGRPASVPAFARPTLETVVVPRDDVDRGALQTALGQLAEQDPLIDVRQDDERREISVSLYGEVQKEVVQATLADDYGLVVTFRETTTICVERPVGTGAAFEIIDTDGNPFLATVGLRVEPAGAGAGVDVRLGVELGSMPIAFFRAVEEAVHDTLRQGLHGWQVPDAVVTVTHSGYWPRQSHAHGTFDKSMSSTAGDFRNLTPLVLMTALGRAGTEVLEPLNDFRLEVPTDTLGAVLSTLARWGAVPLRTDVHRDQTVLSGEVPAAAVHGLTQVLPGLTHGDGLLESVLARYRPVTGAVPERPRCGPDPGDRKTYLLAVVRRAGAAVGAR
jgi:ribosomal protection tetracycline resistance protein